MTQDPLNPAGGNRYELLVQSVVDYAIFMLDLDGRVATWNPGARQIKGYEADEIVGEHFSRFYTDADRDAGRPEMALRTIQEHGRFADEGWRVRKDGSRFWALVIMDAVRDEAGTLIGYVKVTRDVTERRRVQLALEESERRFRYLVQGVTDYAIYMLDPDGIVTNWNAGAERIKGYRPDEIVGTHFSRFFTPEDLASGLPDRALKTAAAEGRFESEGWRVRKDGSRFWAMAVVDAIYEDNGSLLGFAKITRDITERRDAQQRLKETQEQLFQAQKMEALGQLTGGLAHDFNNLLTAILGAADLARRSVTDNPRTMRLLDSICASAQRGGSLTKQLLAFARKQPLEPRTIDLGELLPATAALIRPSLKAIDLVVTVGDGTWKIEADPGQLELSILNLAFNARDAMPDGGTLRLTVRNIVLDGAFDDLIGDHVVITVSDTGTGIPPEILTRVLEPFFTTKGFGKGTGLGLSQAYGFARQSGGTLRLESEIGKGTSVSLYLPARPSSGPGAIAGDASSRSLGNILVVDDDLSVAELAAEFAQELGYAAQVVHSGADALDLLGRHGRIDLVFSDVVMPGGINGLELAKKVRTRFPELPVLLTSGYSTSLGGEVGNYPFLAKPYMLEEFRAAVSALLPSPARTGIADPG